MSFFIVINYLNLFFAQCLYFLGLREYHSKKECNDEENLIKIKRTESSVFKKETIRPDYIYHKIDSEDVERTLLSKIENKCANCHQQFKINSLEHIVMGAKFCNYCWEWGGMKNKFRKKINLYS